MVLQDGVTNVYYYPVIGHTEIWEHVFNFYDMELNFYLFI